MKNVIIFSVCMLCAVIHLQAQQKINVQNGTKAEFYSSLDSAIQKAVAGDTIYIPGGVIQTQGDLTIDKKLTIIGVGWDMDSIGGVSITDIHSRNINFNTGSDGSLLTGCNFDHINIGQNGQNVQNITIWRNKANSGIALSGNVKQCFISESIGGIAGNGASDCEINNNVFWGISFFNNSRIYNNVSQGGFNYMTNCTVENNYISGSAPGSCNNSYFNNNAFSGNFTFPVGTNIGNNNLMSQDPVNTFVAGSDISQPKNVVVRDTSPCKNYGTDGTDIGIYGGTKPYKTGALPFNPHLTKVLIPAQVDKNGNIKVNIAVEAQNR